MNTRDVPCLHVDGAVTPDLLTAELPRLLAAVPPAYFRARRWFGSKANEIAGLRPRDHAVILAGDPVALLVLVDVVFTGGSAERYFLPLALRDAAVGAPLLRDDPASVILAIASPAGTTLLYEAFVDPTFCRALFQRIAAARPLRAAAGTFHFLPTGAAALPAPGTVRRLAVEQSNTSLVYDDAFILKSFRKLQPGVNLDLEVTRFLTTKTAFRNTPLLAGCVEYAGDDGFQTSIAALQRFVPNEGDGWIYTMRHLAQLFQYARTVAGKTRAESAIARFSASYLAAVRRLGQITGAMHDALASDPTDPDFAAQPVSQADLVEWTAGLSTHVSSVLRMLEKMKATYPADLQPQIEEVLRREGAYHARVAALLALGELPVAKIRHHGDYHLGQVLRAGDDFLVVDFEGEPERPLAERRARHLALKDVAGMLRSFNYAANAALFEHGAADNAILARWAGAWESLTRAAYLDGYLGATLARGASFLPPTRPLVEQILAIFELDKAIYELAYEANNRPQWLRIPLQHLAAP